MVREVAGGGKIFIWNVSPKLARLFKLTTFLARYNQRNFPPLVDHNLAKALDFPLKQHFIN